MKKEVKERNRVMEKTVLGRCPKCGADIVSGMYGAYCMGKCGMMLSKAFGKELTDEQVRDLLEGKKILLENLISKNTGNPYDICLTATGYEDYTFTRKDGTEGVGARLVFEREFPEKTTEPAKEHAPAMGYVSITQIDEAELPFR